MQTYRFRNYFKIAILVFVFSMLYQGCQQDIIEIEAQENQAKNSLFTTIDFKIFKDNVIDKDLKNTDINNVISGEQILSEKPGYKTKSTDFVISIDSLDVLMVNKDGVTSYTFKTFTHDMSKTTNYILAHDENNNIDEYYLTYENDGSSKVIDPSTGYEATIQKRGSVWCPITERQLRCDCHPSHSVGEFCTCDSWSNQTIVIGNEYCGSSLGEGGGGGSGGGDGDGSGGGSGTDGGNDLPIDGEIITKPLFNANQVLNDCLDYHNSAHYDVLLLDVINNSIHVDVKTAMANYLQANGCSQETTDTLDRLADYWLDGQITYKEAELTLKTLSNDTPWTDNPGVYNGVAALAYTQTRTIISNGRLHSQFKLTDGDILSSSSYPPTAGSSELVDVLFYFSQTTKKWYDFQEPTSYSPLTLDFLWDGFWSAVRTAVIVTTPLEDIIILIEGRDLEGVEQSRAVAATWILVDIIPGSAALKTIKLVKYGDEAIQVAEAVIKYVDDIYKSQKEIIDNVLNQADWFELDLFGSSIRKANFGEMVTDVDMFSKGYEPLHIRTDYLDDSSVLNGGIDHIFKNPQTGEFVIIESKFGSSQLNQNTLDGPQMGYDWITGSNRIENAVGDPILANQIETSGFTSVLAEISEINGDIIYFVLDNLGQKIGPWNF